MKKMTYLFCLLPTLSMAVQSYTCQVYGEYKNIDGEVATSNSENILVKANGEPTLFGRQAEPEHDWDMRPEVMPWSLSIDTVRDGGETPLVLTLKAPNQNAYIGKAYSESQSKYIGIVLGSELEAICKKI